MAAETPAPDGVGRRKRRRRVGCILVPVILLAIGWPVVERIIDVERYRPLIDKELELLIELPVSMGAMDLQLFPTPRLVVEDVVVGEADFMAKAPRVSVTADLSALIDRRLDLRMVTIHDVQIQLSARNDAFTDRWGDYMLALATPDPSNGKPMITVTLAEITAPNLVVIRGDKVTAEGSLAVHDVTGGAPQFDYDLVGSGMAGEPQATGTFALTVDEDPVLKGAAEVTGLPLTTITGDQGLPAFLLTTTMEYQLSQDDVFTWNNAGTMGIRGHQADQGPFSMTGRLGGGVYLLQDLNVQLPQITFQGDLELTSGPAWSLDITEARLVDEGVDWLLTFLPDLPFRPSDIDVPQCTLVQMQFGENDHGVFEISKGVVRTEGVEIVIDDPGFVLAGLESTVSIAGDTYAIERISSDYLTVQGAVRTLENGQIALDLTGKGQLGPSFPVPGSWADKVRLDRGIIDITHATMVLDDGVPDFATAEITSTIQEAAIGLWDVEQQDFVVLDAIGGGISLTEGALHLSDLAAVGSVVNGEIVPDENFEQWVFTTSFTSDLASPFWKPFYPDSQLTVVAGDLRCDRLAGIYDSIAGHVVDLDMDGKATGLALDLHLADYEDRVQIDSVDITAKETRVTFGVKGKTQTLGPIFAEGEYGLDEEVLAAAIRFRPAVAGKNLIPAQYWDDYGDPILSPMESMTVTLRHPVNDHIVTLGAESPVALSGTIALTEGGVVRNVVLNVSTPANWIEKHAPATTTVAGLMGVGLKFATDTGVLDAQLRLTNAEFAYGKLKKPAGFMAEATLGGTWKKGGLEDGIGRLQFGERHIPFRVDQDGVHVDEFDIGLDLFDAILPPEASLEGRLRGRVSANPAQSNFEFLDVSLRTNDRAPVVDLDGGVDYADGRWSLDGLQLALGGQAVDVSVHNGGGSWQGTMHAEHLDLDQALRDYGDLTDRWVEKKIGAETNAATRARGPRGSIALSADVLTWEDAALSDVNCILELKAGAQHFTGLAFASGSGLGRGTVVLHEARGSVPSRLDVDMVLMSMDLGVIESSFIGTSREMYGAVDGRAVFSIQLPDDETSLAAGMDGHIDFTARNGSLGKAGLASMLLTALRTTDILRMRIPSLRDKGVTFEALAGTLVIEDGVYTLAPFHMEDTMFVLEANAILDYQKNTADGIMELELLEGVTGMARKIPILGQAANAMNKAFGVELKISGTAEEPTFSAGTPGPLRSLESGARTLLRGTQKLVGQ